MARPNKEFNEKEKQEIALMAGLGLRHSDIAAIKGVCVDTLKKYCEEELDHGKAKARLQVMQSAFKQAISGKTPAMTMFWLKTQCGWSEKNAEPDIAPPVIILPGVDTDRIC